MKAVTHVMAFADRGQGNAFSGAERHLFELMDAQQKAGLTVELVMLVFCPGQLLDSKCDELNNRGIKVFTFPAGNSLIPGKWGRRAGFTVLVYKLAQFFSKRRRHIIHTHLEHADLLAKPAAWMARCPNIVTSVHNDEPHYNRWNWRWTLKALDRATKHYIAISQAVRIQLINTVGIDASKITHISYGVSESMQGPNKSELRTRWRIPTDHFVAGFVGRFTQQKNLRTLLAAAAKLPHIHFVLAGAGPMEHELRQLVLNNSIKNVQFLGWQPEGREVIRALDLLCLPSHWEGLGLVLVEAMLEGVAIVGSTAGAIPDVLGQGKYGLIVEPSDIDGLKDAIDSVYERPDLARERARRAGVYARTTFVVEQMLNATANVYERSAVSRVA